MAKSGLSKTLDILGLKYLALSFDYAYDGLTGTSNWIGFAIAAVYYFLKDYPDYADIMCKVTGYLAQVISMAHDLIAFTATAPASSSSSTAWELKFHAIIGNKKQYIL